MPCKRKTMGFTKNIFTWNNTRQGVHLEDKRSVLNYDSTKLAKKGGGTLEYDQKLSGDPRLKFARKNFCGIS